MEEHKIATESKREDPYSSLFVVKGVCIILFRKVSENLVREFDQLFHPTPSGAPPSFSPRPFL
jgi:hypothetical protein